MTTKPYNLDSKCSCNLESYDQHGYFGTKFRGSKFLIYCGRFFLNKREYSWAGWLDLLISLAKKVNKRLGFNRYKVRYFVLLFQTFPTKVKVKIM